MIGPRAVAGSKEPVHQDFAPASYSDAALLSLPGLARKRKSVVYPWAKIVWAQIAT